MRNLILIISLASLAGCSSGSVKDAARARLIDPDSAQFRNITYSDTKNFACVEVNAKDSKGAFRRTEAIYKKTNGTWTYDTDYPETHDECVELINTLDRTAAPKKH